MYKFSRAFLISALLLWTICLSSLTATAQTQNGCQSRILQGLRSLLRTQAPARVETAPELALSATQAPPLAPHGRVAQTLHTVAKKDLGEFHELDGDLLEVKAKYRGEQNGTWVWNDAITKKAYFHVHYMTETERAPLKVHTAQGRLANFYGVAIDTTAAPNGEGLFVVDRNGNFYILNDNETGRLHHSTIMAGDPVLMAGTITVHKGVITHLTNDCGHYRATPEQLKKFADLLRHKGINVDPVVVKPVMAD